MNRTERLLRILNHLPVDRIPVTGFLVSITKELMEAVDVKLPEAHHDPARMVKLAAAAHELLGLESMKLPFDMTVEAGSVGAEIDYGSMTSLPQVKKHPYEDPEEFLLKGDWMGKGRIPLVLKAIRIARKEYGDRVPVISSIVGPVTLSGMLFGLENLLFWMLSEPGKYASALKKTNQLCIRYASEQFRAGSHVVQIAEPVSSGDMISPEQYRKFVLPYHRDLCLPFDLPIVIHICSDITGHVSSLEELNINGISFDQKTNTETVVKRLKGRIALIGSISTSLLLNGTSAEVYESSMACLNGGVDVLNSGCAWPIETPNENIKAMIRANEEWFRQK